MKKIISIFLFFTLLCGTDAHALAPLKDEAISVSAPSALLMEKATGEILYEKNAHERLQPASVTKVMTMLLIVEDIEAGKLRLDDTVTASSRAASFGGSCVYLEEGERMSVSEMLKCIAVVSANDCAVAMAEHISGTEQVFVERMNSRAKELGMEDTQFVNCTGLDDGENAREHRTSAWDIALMSRQLIGHHPKIKEFTTIWMDTIRNGTFGLSNTNKLIRFYSGATGLKTGFTSGAGYCLSATAQREGMELIAVVMGCETAPIRNSACKAMLDYGFANYAVVTPEMPDAEGVSVRLGNVEKISVKPEREPRLLLEKSQKNSVTTEVTLEESVTAPVVQGQKLGVMTVKAGEKILEEIPLVAVAEVARLNWRELTVRVLRQVAMAKENR
jgi:D-alanyl-D-alanine carboxypeptidase (penicillin-binding protein 5/6)